MARKKVKLMWIVNDAARKASLKKRRDGLLKKVSELTILCGIEAFVIIYCPDDPEPAIWPSRPDVRRLATRFQNIPAMERSKKMMNQESYLKERMGKLNDQSRKHLKMNRELEMDDLMQQVYQEQGFDGLDETQLCCLAWLVAEKMKVIRKRIGYFQQIPPLQDASLPQGPFPDDDGDGDGTGGQVRGEPGDGRNNPTDGGVPWDQWLADIVSNPDHNVARGNNIFGLRLSRSRITGGISGGNSFDLRLLPHDNDILRGRISSGGNDFDAGLPVGITMLGCKNSGNSFDPWLSRGLGFNRGGKTSAGNNFDPAGLAQGSDTRSGSGGGNNFDVLWLPHHVKNIDSAAVNNVDPWLAASTGDNGGESLGLGLLPGSNFSGSGAGGNPFHGMHRRGDSDESGDI
ncbi:MADS BOX PROTEIN [Salix koriyanagi]|uniref:MADS BOX PROTEIN n=1 Tax=Salix koriyanagi TaxID=2511006 RepID=A0A9Q0X3Z9_9ROSI|nr:MADS BOX PROTEIN [Salix koriyanagi]